MEKMPIDFDALQNKEVEVSDYFNGLIAKGWKYDREEADLFYYLSKTFWDAGIKVHLFFEDAHSLPPEDETGVIERIAFYSFDKNKYLPKDIHTEYAEKAHKYHSSVEAYIDHLENAFSWTLYVAHSDFNSVGDDFDLLSLIDDLEKVPAAIQQEIWDDLQSCDNE